MKSVGSIITECVTVVRHVRYSQMLSTVFKSEQKSSEGSAKLPVKKRWGSTVQCLKSLLVNKHSLQALAIDDSVKEYLNNIVKQTLLSEVYWDKV